MSDLINRQDAIDAINKAFERVFVWDGTAPLGEKVLQDVPSAQPEIVRCKDCKYWDQVLYDIGKCPNVRRDVAVWWGGDDFCSRAERREAET